MVKSVWGACLWLLASVVPISVHAAVPESVNELVPGASMVGEARYSYLFWDVYDARLYAPQGNWQPSSPFALALTYLRDFDGKDIAERSVKEMREQGMKDEQRLSQWQQKMQALFPDVAENDTITGIRTEQGTARFYLNSELLGEVKEPDFAKWFFNIWLGQETTEPEFRAKLLELEE